MLSSLEKERLRWRKEVLEAQEREKLELEAAVAALRLWAEERGKLEEVVRFAQEKAWLEVTHGASGKPPPPPEGFGVKPKKVLEVATLEGAEDAASGPITPLEASTSTAVTLEETNDAAAGPIAPPEAPTPTSGPITPLEASTSIPSALDLTQLEAEDWFAWARTETKLEDLDDRLKDRILKAMTGVGVCSKCRFRHGCLDCDAEKAWRWALRQHWGLKRGDLRPKAKAKGRPKAKAA